ncbi:hypothetical protein DBV05_g10747 [Lasiodiplodia theobromae]|uniref:Uncharacterized protein n=1 Tax=Lasiodiplodia theobromae TaxID=45133 RepID=A0A5N5CYX0_9PEZI|nr:hypothetical protein DBV05_g10747 [Lasiodiplodia theobromae]
MGAENTLWAILALLSPVVAAPMAAQDDDGATTAGPQLKIASGTGRVALLWTSISLAVFTSLVQGLITTVIQISEDQGLWTFRFRLARYEHIWWTVVSSVLSVSFVLIILTFLAGNTQDSLGVLALSTATTIAIVRYAVPAWRNRAFIENRWRAWTGPSRTSIKAGSRALCGDAAQWKRLSQALPERKMVSAPSDDWGLSLFPPPGLWEDPTALLDKFADQDASKYAAPDAHARCVYDDGTTTGNVSLQWGEAQGFRRRVSRAIHAMPKGLLASRPLTVDEYNGEGLTLALGILGRNKGLRPHTLVFDASDAWKTRRGIGRSQPHTRVQHALESGSAWAPRPSKVMRSYYAHAVDGQFGTLPDAFRDAATELALVLLDVPPRPLRVWLERGLEQQDLDVNLCMSGRTAGSSSSRAVATNEQLNQLYRASYASMVVSLNYLLLQPPAATADADADTKQQSPHQHLHPVRPDLTCFALLHLAEQSVRLDEKAGEWVAGPGAPMPAWWGDAWVHARLRREQACLKPGWKDPAAWLLGLKSFPPELDALECQPAAWPRVVYEPERGEVGV